MFSIMINQHTSKRLYQIFIFCQTPEFYSPKFYDHCYDWHVCSIIARWHALSSHCQCYSRIVTWHCETVSDALMMSFTSVPTRGRLTDVYKSPEDRLVSEQTVGVFLARKYDFDDRTENDFFLEWWEREVTGHERRGRGGCWLREGKARSMPVGEEKTWGHVWLWGGGERRVHWEVRESGKNLRSHPHPTLQVTSPERCKMLLSPLGCMIINSCIPGLLKFNSRQTIRL